MGAAGFHGRVRDGIGWGTRAMDHRVGVTSLSETRSCSSFWSTGRSACLRPVGVDPWEREERRAALSLDDCVSGRCRDARDRAFVSCTGRSLVWGEIEADRAISIGQLHALLHLHFRPIDVVVCHGPDRETSF